MISQAHPVETNTFFQGFQIILRIFFFTDINIFLFGFNLHKDFRLGYVNLRIYNKKPTSAGMNVL